MNFKEEITRLKKTQKIRTETTKFLQIKINNPS